MVGLTTKNRTHDLIERKLRVVDPWYQLIVKMLKQCVHEFNGKMILEVGCGLGGFCINVARQGSNVVGLDISSNAIHKAKKLAKQLNVQNRVDFIIGDAHFLPFKEQTAEIVVCSETLEHVANYENAFSELVRVTKRLGYLCLTVPNLLSTLFFEYVVLRFIGQPQYAKKLGSLEKENIFDIFKLRKLLNREDLRVLEIRSTDFLHIPPRIRRALKIGPSLKVISDNIEDYLVAQGLPFRLLGANIGVLARKE